MSSPFFSRIVSTALCFAALGGASGLTASPASNETGVRLLRAELPAKMTIPQTDCELLARAVRRATLGHRREAPVILAAALAGDAGHPRPCACVERLFRASVAAAPGAANALLETTEALYPDCADALEAGLDHPDADDASMNDAGFGVGFGPGFPGSPSFTGSPPSAGLALPPVAVTTVVNG